MQLKTLIKGIYHLGPKIKAQRSRMDNLELLLAAAQFIPHPTVKVLTRSAGTGLVWYKNYQRLKNLPIKSKNNPS
jgi:hypothetical protein